jgi:hypothetical protein
MRIFAEKSLRFSFFVRQFIFLNKYVGWGWEVFSVVFFVIRGVAIK